MVVRKLHQEPTRVPGGAMGAGGTLLGEPTGGLHPPPHRRRGGQHEGGHVFLTSLIAMETATCLPQGLATSVNHKAVTTGSPRCTDGSPGGCGLKVTDIQNREYLQHNMASKSIYRSPS